MRRSNGKFKSFGGLQNICNTEHKLLFLCILLIYFFPSYCVQAKSKGVHTKSDIGVKYAEKQQRRFAPEKLKEGRNVIGLQVSLCFSIIYFVYRNFIGLICLVCTLSGTTRNMLNPNTFSKNCNNMIERHMLHKINTKSGLLSLVYYLLAPCIKTD